MRELFRKKSIDKLLADSKEHEHKKLKRVLSVWDLTAIGVGCIIGTGIFVLTGVASIKYAGPGIMISFIISGLACVFAALCYAEFASRIPLAGSAYTYGYASLGEIFAWIIGWDLILEYAVASGAVAIGWSGYFVNLLQMWFGINLPAFLTTIHSPQHPEGLINLPAAIIVLLVTALLVWGIKQSATVNSVIVVIKVSIAIFFIGVGIFFIKFANWHPLIPPFVPNPQMAADFLETPVLNSILNFFGVVYPQGFGGWPGIFTASAIVFFAYIGFDAVSTTAEEAKNPQRDLPIGIIASLIICTVLYIAMAAVFTGIVKCDGVLKVSDLGAFEGAPMAYAFRQIGVGWVSKFASGLISIGAICGITSVLIVTLLGQTRIFFAMARDKMLPQVVSKVHRKFKTPYITTIVTGIIIAFAASVTPIEIIAELANIGTLFAFLIVCSGILFLRKMKDEQKKSAEFFKTPGAPWIPILGVIFSLFLMISLPLRTWYRFLGWFVLGLTIYFCYSYFNSELREKFLKTAQGLACSVVGLIYIIFQPFFLKIYPTLIGKLPSVIFIFGLSLLLLVLGIWRGALVLKKSAEDLKDKRMALFSLTAGFIGIIIWIVSVFRYFAG